MSQNKRKIEASDERSASSVTDHIDKVISVLKRQSRFFVRIDGSEFQNLTDALQELDNFLDVADEDSVEEVTRESVKTWLEEPGVNSSLEKDAVPKLSRLLQKRRIIDFLSRASERFSRLNSDRSLSPDILSSKASPLDDKQKDSKQEEEEEETVVTGFFAQQNRKLFYSFLEDYLDSAAKDVTERLLQGTITCSVIALVGPSGIGKTIIARKVYDSDIIADHFDCFGWIDASRLYTLKEILKAMIQQIAGDERHDVEGLDGMRTMELVGILRKSLQPKRYMFVFDDVCQEHLWNLIGNSLPENEKGGRIIVTTTSDKVGVSCTESPLNHVHRLSRLSDGMSWELFCRIAFHDLPRQLCPAALEHLALEFLRVCQGFPLSIVAIAGLLSTKELVVLEWKKLYHNFRREFKFNSRAPGALEVLTLSFCDLPNHLRSCLLYFVIFPEESIPVEKLFKLWIAEGFVEEKRGRTLKEVAAEYLNELIHRDLVKPGQASYGLEQFCLVHRLIHDMAKVKARELSFCLIRDGNVPNFRRNNLRLSIYNVDNALETLEKGHVRAVFLFNIGALQSSFMINLMEQCEHLTLLDLEKVPIEDLPEELGNLLYLKYLSLKNTKVSKLPESLGKLHNLQMLDLRNTLLRELPLEISELRSLQHLLAAVHDRITRRDSTRGVRMKGEIRWLEKLHTLMILDVRLGGIALIQELANLRKLRRLGISGLTAEVGSALCTAIDELIHLENLTLQAKNNEILRLQTISTMLPRLKSLVLKGQLQKFPYLISGLPNLTTLCLSLSKLTNIPLIDLSRLPNLASLWLYRAYEGETLCFKKSGFQRLKMLVLRELHGLNTLEIEEDALPQLEELRIGSSPLLNEVPSGFQNLKNLKVLQNYDMPSEYALNMQPRGGADYSRIKHIPSVNFWYKVHGRSYKSYKLGDSDLLDHLEGLATNTDFFAQHPDELELSFCNSDDEEDYGDDDVDHLRFSRAPTFFVPMGSFSSGFYTDDVEE